MLLTPGTRLGPYEVLAQIGAGGMGEVYRGRDTKLDRDVAIKILPEAFAHDADRLARFQREAKTLASLNHPNIAAIYGLEESGGMTALVMELVEGDDLSQRLARGAIPIDEALPIAKQIAEALEAAHEQGIIHRDLKPANIKVRADGTVKVLDFGLAKAMEPTAAMSASASMSPTITTPAMTQAGMILGTAAYMSPEQAKGREADKRSDVWAFGAVLYEMLTGRRAFDGEDVSDTLAAILMRDPDWSSVPPALPRPVRAILRRCLEKNQRKRIADFSVVLFVLEDAASGIEGPVASGLVATTVSSRPSALQWIVTHAVTLVVGGVGASVATWLVMSPAIPHAVRFVITPSGTAAITAIALDRELAITPDATHIVYVGNNGTQLFVRALDQFELKPLAGLGTPRGPFLSPDGQWIGFFDGSGPAVTLKKVTLSGGPAVAICRFTGSQRAGATWGEDGSIVFATTDSASGLWRVSAGGGEPTLLTKPDRRRGDGDHVWPEFLPGGQAVLFTISPQAGAVENSSVAVLDLRSGEQKILVQGGSHAHYVSSGHLVYGVDNTLRAVAFDLRRLEVIGTPVPVLSQVAASRAGAFNFDVARDGTLVYVTGPSTMAFQQWKRTLMWVDRQGREEALGAPVRGYTSPRLSPDGTQVAVGIRDQEEDISIWSLVTKTLRRFTFGAGLDDRPAWTPDGRRLVFDSVASNGIPGLFWQAADGTGTPTRITQGGAIAGETASAVSPDGANVLFTAGNHLMLVGLNEGGRIRPLLQTSFRERNGEISPDGRWLAYEADDSGRFELYVRPFPNVNGGRWQISSSGGFEPVWARSGQELFYRGANGVLMSVPVDSGTVWRQNASAEIFEAPYFNATGQNVGRTYDVSPDAKRFLMIKRDPSERVVLIDAPTQGESRTAEEGLVVVQHFDEELKRLVPTK